MNKELEEVKRQHVELKDEVHELEANLKTLEERAAALKVGIQEDLQRGFDITLENKMVRIIQQRCAQNGYPVGLKLGVFNEILANVKEIANMNKIMQEAQDRREKSEKKSEEALIRSGFSPNNIKLPANVVKLPTTRTFAFQ